MAKQTILVAEDSSTMRKLVCRTLYAAGYHVVPARDGVEALQLAGQDPPDLAVLDIEMPRRDGFAVCEELKRMGEPWNSIPIVFLTASRSHAVEMLGDQLGAYLPKPCSAEALIETVKWFLPDEPAQPGATAEDPRDSGIPTA